MHCLAAESSQWSLPGSAAVRKLSVTVASTSKTAKGELKPAQLAILPYGDLIKRIISAVGQELSGTESATLSRELGNSESYDSNRAISRSQQK